MIDDSNTQLLTWTSIGAFESSNKGTGADTKNNQGYDDGKADQSPEFSYSGTTLSVDGRTFDMRERVLITDSSLSCMSAGSWIIVECHVNPYQSAYEFYNTVSGDFELW